MYLTWHFKSLLMRFRIVLVALVVLVSCRSQKPAGGQLQQNQMSNTMDWMKRTNVYEVNVRQYSREGTFNAFAKDLSRLRDMGVETLWFMPITPIAQKGKKGSLGSYYAASDYTAINPEFGNLQDFKNLVKEAHAQGFKVIIDWVANHTGWDHRWTREHPDWYEKDPATNDFKIASGMDDIIELDFRNYDMRRAMIDAMKYWITEVGIDGFRCDLAFWVELDFWIEARAALQPVKDIFWLAEADPLDHPDYMQVFHAAYTWTWMHRTREWYEKRLPLDSLIPVLERYQKAPGWKAWFTSNHDENSWNGSEYEKYGDAALPLAVFSCTWQGVPLLYNGQELPNKKRLEFFEKDPIEWTGNNQLHGFYKTLLQLHTANAALWADSEVLRLRTSDDAHILAYLRKRGKEEVVVVLNLSPINRTVDLAEGRDGRFKNVFSGSINPFSKQHSLKPWDYVVLEKVGD